MRPRTFDLEGLLELPSLPDIASRRASFRQALASLARSASVDGPSPLDGIATEPLAKSVRIALDAGFLDTLDWLSPAAVGVALFELGAALPAGPEKRELGRRVFGRLHDGAGDVFAAIATRMALGSRRGLAGAAIHARVSLLFSAPPSTVDAGPLAFAFVSRRELAREWIGVASTGSLPARRLAARMLESAALVAARRASQGDDYAPRVFSTDGIATPFARLLADREPLVWRHAAVARGILAGVAAVHWNATIDAVQPKHTPTEWRRGVVSLLASVTTAPDRSIARLRDVIHGPLPTKDAGLLSTMVWGVPRPLDAECEATESLLDAIFHVDPMGGAAGVAAIMRDLDGEGGARLVERAREAVASMAGGNAGASGRADDDHTLSQARALGHDLSRGRQAELSLRQAVLDALACFVREGAREAHAAAGAALEIAAGNIAALEALDAGASEPPPPITRRMGGPPPSTRSGPPSTGRRAMAQRTTELLLRDLDGGLLEESTLSDLLLLGRRAQDDEGVTPAIDDLHARLGRWLIARERRATARTPLEIALSSRRLKALLHLVDAESAPIDEGDDAASASRVRARRREALTMLFDRVLADKRSALHRTLCAALARALDALVRDGMCEWVDVMLIVASRIEEPSDIVTLSEASMNPDLEQALDALARFVRSEGEEPMLLVTVAQPSENDPPSSLMLRAAERSGASFSARVEGILELAEALGEDVSGRAEALRGVLLKLARTLQNMAIATSRKGVAEGYGTSTDALAGAVQAYVQLESGARLRVFGDGAQAPGVPAPPAHTGRLATLLSALSSESVADATTSVHEVIAELRRLLPAAIARPVSEVLGYALSLPRVSASEPPQSRLVVGDELPAWLGTRRTIGGYFIVRPLGGGAAASVFVAKRLEERRLRSAELFALKVPDYNGTAARSLSEQEFMEFFRAEASALLGLPPHPNIARFVTFDLAARPKPILVMELIEGPTLERFVGAAEGAITMRPTAARAFDILDGILAGLEVMHRHSLAHLDVKPSNVILREGKTPTLVDFGLAGRHIRPGCATGSYGAPEIWGVVPDDHPGEVPPFAADVYAFGAMAFEVLTGVTLFDAESDMAIIGQHVTHDGAPPRLELIASIRPLCELLQHTLRRDPRHRWTMSQVRTGLRAVSGVLRDRPWPLAR